MTCHLARASADLSLPTMAVRPIVIVGDPVLHTPTRPVPVGEDGSLPADLADLIADMYETMDAAYGVGLAANQIGVPLRVFVYDCADEKGRQKEVEIESEDQFQRLASSVEQIAELNGYELALTIEEVAVAAPTKGKTGGAATTETQAQ